MKVDLKSINSDESNGNVSQKAVAAVDSNQESLVLTNPQQMPFDFIVDIDLDAVSGVVYARTYYGKYIPISGFITNDNISTVRVVQHSKAGMPGLRGFSGKNGKDGLDGLTGLQGPKGDTGLTGPKGVTGDDGLPGLDGDRGPKGLAGNRGRIGPKGRPGVQGRRGLPGEKGIKGPTGADGMPGDRGLIGKTGLRGIQGIVGLPGVDGPKGPTGCKGETGEPGCDGADGKDMPPCPDGKDGEDGKVTQLIAGDNVTIQSMGNGVYKVSCNRKCATFSPAPAPAPAPAPVPAPAPAPAPLASAVDITLESVANCIQDMNDFPNGAKTYVAPNTGEYRISYKSGAMSPWPTDAEATANGVSGPWTVGLTVRFGASKGTLISPPGLDANWHPTSSAAEAAASSWSTKISLNAGDTLYMLITEPNCPDNRGSITFTVAQES